MMQLTISILFLECVRYKKLVLIAGGVGITPFLAVLSDIFQLVRSGKPCLLQDILLVWAVKKSNELSLLSTIDIKLLVPPNLDILVYITQESEPPLMVSYTYFQFNFRIQILKLI